MLDYIKGSIVELSPTDVVIDCHNIGFHAQISIQTYSVLENQTECILYLHHVLREDEELFYGFSSKDERELFRLLIGVSGVGVGTARMMLSSLSCDEIREAIISENINRIKAVKGIGLKTAQRLVLELKDKVIKGEGSVSNAIFSVPSDSVSEEASAALVMLGFSKTSVNKVISEIVKNNPGISVETIIKSALQKL